MTGEELRNLFEKEGEGASIVYCTDVSPVGLNTQPISMGVPSSHMKETGEVDSSGDRTEQGSDGGLEETAEPFPCLFRVR